MIPAPASASTNPSASLLPARGPRLRFSLFWVVATGFALRLALIFLAHTYRFKPDEEYFSFGYEMGRVGRALALGRGFADPFGPETGPTAWEPPLYPFLVGGVFKLAGIYTRSSALILLSLNSLFSALTSVPIFLIARRCFSNKVALWSSWAWAVFPTIMYWSARWVWETSLAALLLAILFLWTLKLEELPGAKPWIAYGMLWGVAALTNPSLVSFVPAAGVWVWYRRRASGRRWLVNGLLAAVFFTATIAPWLLRNYETFGRFVFIRSNFGAELRLGNGPGADGTWMSYLHPTQNRLALKEYEQLGEIEYVTERRQQALEYIRADYGRFAWLSCKRFIYYWAGRPRASEASALVDNSAFLASSVLGFWGLFRALRRRRPGAWLFFWLLLSYPAVYYFVYPHSRYRHPIEPELVILIAYVISEASPRHRLPPDTKAASPMLE